MKKRALSWLLALTMLLTLAPQALPVWASATGEKSSTATQNESKLSANTYSALGLSRSIKPSDEGLDQGKQPYGDAVEGNTVATNVINELYVNFNGSIHYGWSILDNLTMQYKTNISDWNSSENFYGAMAYWRYGQQRVAFKYGDTSLSALFAEDKNGKVTVSDHNETINGNKSSSISSANKHLVYQYSKSEAFSPNTGKDNYVAELVVSDDGMVSLYIYQVEGGNKRYVRGTNIGKNPYVGDANDKTNIIWNWEYDAMFDIAAGDMDGDGYDEIAVYTANQVYVYSYKNNILSKYTEREVTHMGSSNGDPKYKKLSTVVVTLAFGDLNADDKDELVIAESMPYDSLYVDKGTVGIYALDGKKLDNKWSTDLKDGDKLIRYANVATGDIDGNYKDELVIAGYYSDNNRTATCKKDKFYYKIVKFENNAYTDSGWGQANQEIDLLQRVVDNSYQLIPPVSLTCAATQGVGYAEQVFLGGCLYTVNSDNSLKYLTRISTNREYKKDDGKKANKEEIFVVNVVAGNFNGNRYGQEQIIYAFGMKHDDSDRYWYDIGYINKKATGDTDATSSSGYWYGQEQVMNFESSYNRDSNKRRASLYLSLAAVDCDNDSTLMRYKGQEVTWTKPEVLTILQSAPYFQDLEDTRGYLNQSQTAYGKGNGITSSATAGGGLSIGTYVSFEQDFSVFGVKIASIEAEAQSKHSFNYSYEGSTTKTISVAYSGSAGDDYAIVYAVPFMEYQYETWVPGYTLDEANYNTYLDNYLEGKLGKSTWEAITNKEAERQKAAKELGITPGMEVKGSWQPSTVSVPMTPRTVILSVDSYDEIATQTEGLEPIRGNVLNSTPGDPSSYTKIGTSNGFKAIGKQQTVTNAEGSNTQIEGVKEDNQEHKFEYSYEFEAKAGVGAGGLTVGVLAGFEANAGGGTGKSESKTYTATVDNLPKDASGYTFDWQFGTREAELNGNPVLVLEYQLDNVNQLPSPPRNLRVEAVTSDSVTLQWDAIPGAGSYEIYQITSAGKKILVDTVPGTATSYTDTSVDPNNSYTYCMKNITKGGTASIFSTKAEAYTLMQNSGKFIIKKQPGENNTFSTYVGGTATATVQAEYLDQDGNDKKIHYTWEKYDTNSKEWVDYARGNTISISQVKDEMDGDKFRCQVYYNANLYIYTEPLTLEVGQAKSTTTLSSEQAGTTVNASYVETNEVKTGETKEVPVEVTVRNKKYTVYTTNDATVYLGEDGKYYSINGENATEISEESKNVQLTYTIKTGTGENTTEELKTISFDQLDPDTTFNGTTTPAVTYEYRDEESETAKTTYTANEKYTYAGHPTVEVYNCHENATEDKPASDFWFVKIGESKYAADVETTIVLKINDSKRIDVNDLVQSTTKEDATKSQQTYVEGTTVTLTANVNDANEGASDKPTGNVVFKIVNSVGDGSGTVTGTIGEDGVATATWKPSVAGVYTITAAYEGSEIHMGSASAGSITINVVVPGEKKLVIDSPNSMTYGDAAIDLKATLLSGAEGSGTGSAAPVTATYSVKDAAGNTVSNAIAENKFAPKAAGNYTITATCTVGGKSFTATKTIHVGKRTVKIVPKVENNITSYTLENIVSADDSLFNGKINVTCAGVTTGAAAGQYPINVTYTPGTDDNAKTIDSRYLVILDTTQVYTVSDDVVKVTNATNSNNGTVTLQYTVTNTTGSNTFNLGNGTEVPKGAKLTATASPHKGYKVKKWIVNGNPVYLNGTGGTLNTAPTIIVADKVQPTNAADKGYTVTAEFEAVNYTLAFEVEDGKGTVKAHYMNGATEGSPFANKSGLSPLDTVQLTAKVNDGYSIKGWEITTGSSKTEIIQENGKNYTGSSYKLSSISADTKVTVLVESTTEQKVSIALVNSKEDGNTEPLTIEGAKVTFITEEGTQNVTPANSIYIYQANKHDNLTVQITLPNGWIVDEWTDSAGNAMQDNNLSNDKKSWKVSDLSEDFTWTVKCKTPNSYTVTTKTMLGEAENSVGGTITVYKVGTDDEVVASGSSVLQATGLRVKVNPNSGYQLMDVALYDGDTKIKELGQNSDFTIDSVNSNTNIVATFVKKPVVTFTAGSNGTIEVSNGPSVSGGTVPYGYKNDIVFTAKPEHGYEVDKWTVNTTEVNGQKVANSDNQTYTYTPDATTGITSDVTVKVSFKELPTATVNFSVVDKNGADQAGGFDGSVTASVARKNMSDYEQNVENITTGQALTVYRDSTVALSAQPDTGYVAKWIYNGQESLTPPTLDFSPTATLKDHNVQVRFDQIGQAITFTKTGGNSSEITGKIKPDNGNEADFQSGNIPNTNGTLTLTVTPDAGYEVEGWYVNGTEQDNSAKQNTFEYPVKHDVGAAIEVKIIRSSYEVNFSAVNGNIAATKPTNVTIESGDLVQGDTSVTFTATPAQPTGYTFAGWKINDKTPSEYSDATAHENGTLTVAIKEPVRVAVTYTQDVTRHTVTYGVDGETLGTLTTNLSASPAMIANGEKATFTATPKEENYVVGWYSDAACTQRISETGEETSYSVNIYDDTAVYVKFAAKPTYEISLAKNGNGKVFASVNDGAETEVTGNTLAVKYHDKVVFRAQADDNHYFVGWQDNTKGTYTIADVTGPASVTATFAPTQSVYLKASSTNTSKGTLTATGSVTGSIATNTDGNGVQVAGGEKITLTAHPVDGQMVKEWKIGDTVQSGNLSNTLEIDSIMKDTTVTVEFENYVGHTIPTTSAGYTISDVTRIPDDTTPDTAIRDRGTVIFKVTPKAGKLMGVKSVSPNGTVVANADGSYTVTIKNVTEAINFQMEEYKTINPPLESLPNALSGTFSSVDALKTALRAKLNSAVTSANMAYLDIQLQYLDGTEWKTITDAAHFPKGGINVKVLYKDLAATNTPDNSYNYSVIHMFTTGTEIGQTETLTVTKKDDTGITFHVNSLSPFAIGWYKNTPTPGGGGGGGGGGAVSTYTLTFDTNGGSAIDKITKDSGTTIDLAAYKPTRAGYTFAGWFSDKALTKAVTSVKLTANTTVYAKWTQNGGTAQNPFVDVKEGAYYYDAVLWAVEQKITSGTSATTFSPDASCTRAQMVTFLWRAAGSPKVENGKNPFTDVKADAYYYDAVLWAVEKGVTSGTSATTFSPDATVTRGQTVTFLYRNAGSPEVSGTMPFTDVEADAYYAKAVQWAVQQKITTGTSETTFSPMSDCTRGQIVTFLYRAK